MPTMFLDDPGFDWIRGFQLRLEMQERQGFLHLAALYKPKFGVPKGIRTPVAGVKGQCPGPLDDGDACFWLGR